MRNPYVTEEYSMMAMAQVVVCRMLQVKDWRQWIGWKAEFGLRIGTEFVIMHVDQ